MKKTYGIMIQEGNKSIEVFESAFERNIGDILTINGRRFKVVSLEPSKGYAAAYIGTFGKSLFNTYDFNAKNGKK